MKRILTYLMCFLILSCQFNQDKSQKKELNHSDSKSTDLPTQENLSDTLLNTDDYLILGNKLARVKVVNENEIHNFPTFEILIRYRNDVIIGENIDFDNVKIYRKYQPKTSFRDFPVDIYKGELADPDFSTNPSSKRFITRIKNECTKGINFAGKYTLVSWGCGSSCQSGVVIDRITGKIFGGYRTSFGSEFRRDSRLIIKNYGAIDSKTNLIELCAYCEVYHEIWTGTKFEEVK